MEVILSDSNLLTLSNMKLNLKMNQLSTEDDEPVSSECADSVSDHVIVLARLTVKRPPFQVFCFIIHTRNP